MNCTDNSQSRQGLPSMDSNKKKVSEFDYRAFFKSAPDPVLVLDKNLKIVAVNEAYLRVTMTNREEILNRGIFEVFPDNPDEPGATGVRNLSASLNHVLRKKVADVMTVQKYDIRLPAAEGGHFEERYWSLVNSPVIGTDSEIAYIIHRVQDVTEYIRLKQKNIEDEHLAEEMRQRAAHMEAEVYAKSHEVAEINLKLKIANEELEVFNQELKTFNYMVSHDLRQPLNTIGISCQALEMLCSDKLDEDCNNYVKTAYKTMLNMNKLIEALLEFSSSTHCNYERKPVDLGEMAKSVVEELRLSDPNRQVTFNIAEGRMANGDPHLLRSVLQNLIGNSWKYSASQEDVIIDFGSTYVDGKETYFIRDNGEGFDMSEADNLFIPFKRLSGVDGYKGSGIGLATVERIIHRHGGRVWAVAEPGKEATFYFTLPE